mgnify:CR=1 FL=1|tara:strand:- start:1576 stop:1755 length:180 start_codon:yes stop_codon:yes gene_type:complete
MGKGIKNRGSQIHKTKTKYNRSKKIKVDESRAPTQAEVEDMMIDYGSLAVRFGDDDFGL